MEQIETSLDNLLMESIKCDHTLNLLKQVIIGIESYPSLYELKQEELLDTIYINKRNDEYYNKEKLIKEQYVYLKNKNNNSNIKSIKDILNLIEKELKIINKCKINKKIIIKTNYINNKELEKIYEIEIQQHEKKLETLKEKLKKELEKIDKELSFYLEIIKDENNIIIHEKLNKPTSLRDFFQIFTIDYLISDIDIEEYLKEYYKQFYMDNINNNIIHPEINSILLIINKLKYLNYSKYSILEQKSMTNLNITQEISKLDNIYNYMKKNDFIKTAKYVKTIINYLNQTITENNRNIMLDISKDINQIKDMPILTPEEKYIILDVLEFILKITSTEAKEKNCHFQNKSDITNYQDILLKNKYNLNLTTKEIEQILNRDKRTITEAPKTKLLKKIRKIKSILGIIN